MRHRAIFVVVNDVVKVSPPSLSFFLFEGGIVDGVPPRSPFFFLN